MPIQAPWNSFKIGWDKDSNLEQIGTNLGEKNLSEHLKKLLEAFCSLSAKFDGEKSQMSPYVPSDLLLLTYQCLTEPS